MSDDFVPGQIVNTYNTHTPDGLRQFGGTGVVLGRCGDVPDFYRVKLTTGVIINTFLYKEDEQVEEKKPYHLHLVPDKKSTL